MAPGMCCALCVVLCCTEAWRVQGSYVDSSSSMDRLSHMTYHMTHSERPGLHEVAALEEEDEEEKEEAQEAEEEEVRPHIWIPRIPCGRRHQHSYVDLSMCELKLC